MNQRPSVSRGHAVAHEARYPAARVSPGTANSAWRRRMRELCPLALASCCACAGNQAPQPAADSRGQTSPTTASTAVESKSPRDAGAPAEDATAEAEVTTSLPDAAPEAALPCSWTPDARHSDTSAAWGERAGCYLAPPDQRTLAHVASLEIVAIDVTAKRTTIRFVLKNANGERLTPSSGAVRYDVELAKKRKGSTSLAAMTHRDGVYALGLGANAMPRPCEVLVRLSLASNDAIFAVVDEWRPYGC